MAVSAVSPTGSRARAKSGYVGASAASPDEATKPTSARREVRVRALGRRALSSAAAKEPAAMTEPSSPNSFGP